jgi:putative hydrolase of HD superfamily
MVSDLVYLMVRMFSMRRWNNKPTVEQNSEASNSGFILQTAHLLGMLEKLNGKEINFEKLLVRGVLKDMPKCILSDISLETKRTIQRLAPELWMKVYKGAVEDVIKSVPDEWKNEFEDAIINSRDDSLEGKILEAADAYAAYVEADVNSRLFGEYFSEIRDSIKRKMEKIKLDSLKMLLSGENLKKYLTYVRGLMHAIRWNQHSRTVPTTVAGHTLFVVFVAYLLAIEDEKVDVLNVLERSLFHDVPEALTGDIISPTKRRVEGFEQVIEAVESKMVHEDLLPLLPEEIAHHYAPLMLEPFDGGREGKITRAADLIGSLIECKIEMDNGVKASVFERGYKGIKKQLLAMNLDVVRNLIAEL